ncbi:MAG: glutamine-hydrolyzing GMP synthase, partial [archaeon]
ISCIRIVLTLFASLLSKVLAREQLFCLHIDNGLMRKNESAEVKEMLKEIKNFKVVDASKMFLDRLKEKYEPEEKRKIIGQTFIDVANKEIENLGLDDWLLAQGTIYPDTIESGGTKHADVIKTHHNRVDIIKKMIEDKKIVEPVKDLYKEEVRDLGTALGLFENFVWRHPFPGPGLGVRALCSVGKKEEFSVLKEKLNSLGLKYDFDVLPCRSVGVKGDERSYEHPAIISGVWDWKELEKASTRVVNEVRGINRAIYLLPGQSINSMEPIKAYLTKERLDLLREADAIVMGEIEKAGLMRKIWQFPTVLVPVNVNGKGEALILRPVFSTIAMTAKFADLPLEVVESIKKKLLAIKGVGAVFYDITHKPPGTIEWE